MRYDQYRKAVTRDAVGTDAAGRRARPAGEKARAARRAVAPPRRRDQRARSGEGQPASRARRITLLSWLLVVTLALAAEGAWALWVQDVWAASIEASPHAPADDVER